MFVTPNSDSIFIVAQEIFLNYPFCLFIFYCDISKINSHASLKLRLTCANISKKIIFI